VCVCLCIPLIVARQHLGENLLIFARQRLGRNVIVVTNTHAIIEELLDAWFFNVNSVVSRKVGDQFLLSELFFSVLSVALKRKVLVTFP
jgi:hypothetical protein